MVVGVTVACNGGSGDNASQDTPTRNPGDPARGAFITQAMSNESQAFSWAEFQRLAPDFGFTMQMFAGENEPAVEVAGIRTAIAEGYDAIFINPSSIESIIPALMEAKEAGLVIGMFSSELPEASQHLRDFFCGTDDFMGGEQAGKFVVQNFPGGANFVEVGGQAGHDAQIKRHDGFRAGIAGSNIVELDSQNAPTGWNTHEAMTIMENFITRHGDLIDVVFCHWDNGASGVIEALQNQGMHDVFVIGVDGNRTGYAQVADGTQHLSVGQNFTEMVRKSLENARTMLDGGSVPAVNHIPLDMVTADNVHQLPVPPW